MYLTTFNKFAFINYPEHTQIPHYMAHLGPGVLLAEQVSIEVGHLPVPFVCEAPHQLPVTHVVELLPLLLHLTALLKMLDGLKAYKPLRISSS